MKERLGHTYRDRISGFAGVAVGHVEYITGCNQTLLQPKGADTGKRPETEWFDDQRLVIDEMVPRVVIENGVTPGGDREAPKR